MRKYLDCRDFPENHNCSVAISADTDQELMEAMVQHVVAIHKAMDSPELRMHLSDSIHESESGRLQMPRGVPAYLRQELEEIEE